MNNSQSFEFVAGWGDMDSNSHMRNTAYLDHAVTARMMFFQAHGFNATEFSRLGIGPVVFQDEIKYFKEIRLLEPFRVHLTLLEMKEDGSRFKLKNEFFKVDGTRAAEVVSAGAWFDIAARKLVQPPPGIVEAMWKLKAGS